MNYAKYRVPKANKQKPGPKMPANMNACMQRAERFLDTIEKQIQGEANATRQYARIDPTK